MPALRNTLYQSVQLHDPDPRTNYLILEFNNGSRLDVTNNLTLLE